jgi:hypothetical protein
MLYKPNELLNNSYKIELVDAHQTPLAMLELKLSGVSCMSSTLTSTGAPMAP